MSVNRTSLGKRISFYRSKSNLTQEVLAAKVNCSREYIVQIENGTKVAPLNVQLAPNLNGNVPAVGIVQQIFEGNNNSFPKHLRQPCKERRSFGMDVHHIVFSKCTIKCRKCGGADCGKSP